MGILKDHIDNGIIFPKLSISLASRKDEIVASAGSKFESTVASVWRKVREDLDIVFQSPADATRVPVVNETMRSRVRELATTIRDLKRRHERLLQGIQ